MPTPSPRRWGSAALPALILLGCSAEAPPTEPEPIRPSAQYSIQEFLDTTSFAGNAFSPDNSKILVSSDATGIFNAYAVPVGGGELTQLTTSTEESIFAMRYFPDDERFLYTADEGGNELNHVFVRELDGTSVDLTPGEGLRANFLGFARDETSFLIATNERDQRYFDIYEYGVDAPYERELIYQNDDAYTLGGMSPDRRHLVFGKTVTTADSDLYLYDREAGSTTLLTPHEGDVNHNFQAFAPDGRHLYYTTDADSEFRYLVRYALESGEVEEVERADWDILQARFSHGGSYLVVAINNDARTEVRLYDAATMERVQLPALPSADITNIRISRDETLLSFYASSSRTPLDLFVHSLEGDGGPRQLTRSLSGEIEAADLVDGEVVRFASFDGLEVPGVLYRPHQADRDGAQLPALVWVHGGPGGQSRVGYVALIQYLVNHGYVVYAINNRGSSGYGKTFFHLDDRNHGKGDLGDCIASKQMLIDTGYVDPNRIGIIGGSYGGFMVLAALAFEPDEFAVGVDIFGVSNWLRTLQSIPPWWESFRKALEEEMGSAEDEEYLRSISPLFHAQNIQKPLMVLQGANDPRVLRAESDDIVAAARANGAPVEYLVFDDEGHGFRKKENQERGYEAILRFLDQHLTATDTAEAAAGG
ncbi:MAG: alpha/beta fold hydrolase [Acidobacteriota bacterium]